MKRVIVFTGAGVSAESGISTFRDSGGLWEKYDITDVATPEAFEQNPEMVLEFYNQRRRQVLQAEPNDAHRAIAELERTYDVKVITQNVDDLHERAGSSHVIHLHGEIRKVRSSLDPELIYEVGEEGIQLGSTCEKGGQLRPHVVWFGEMVPMMEVAAREMGGADILLVVGSSLNVYPAAGLVHYTPGGIPKYLIDPIAEEDAGMGLKDIIPVPEKAGEGVPRIVRELMEKVPR